MRGARKAIDDMPLEDLERERDRLASIPMKRRSVNDETKLREIERAIDTIKLGGPRW